MKLVEGIKMIWKREAKIIDIWYYLQGNMRYRLYYNSKLQGVAIRPHILEQINYRIKVMRQECYESGSCVKCGCTTTALQMCNKPCEGWCYPRMLSKVDWKRFKEGHIVREKVKNRNLYWIAITTLSNNNPIKSINLMENINGKLKKINNVQRP